MDRDIIRVIVVDDHEIVLMGLKHLLSRVHNIELIAVVHDGYDALLKIEELQPDIVIMDIDIPGMSGIEVTENVVKNFPDIKIILHTAFTDEEHIVAGFEAGAFGYVPKDFKTEELLEAIYTVYSGQRFIKGSVSETFVNSYFKTKKQSEETPQEQEIPLTHREIEILKNVAEGRSNSEIATSLNISIRTVETHKSNIMKKLKIENSVELVKFALKHKLIQL